LGARECDKPFRMDEVSLYRPWAKESRLAGSEQDRAQGAKVRMVGVGIRHRRAAVSWLAQ
jgi:hypothetical protein